MFGEGCGGVVRRFSLRTEWIIKPFPSATVMSFAVEIKSVRKNRKDVRWDSTQRMLEDVETVRHKKAHTMMAKECSAFSFSWKKKLLMGLRFNIFSVVRVLFGFVFFWEGMNRFGETFGAPWRENLISRKSAEWQSFGCLVKQKAKQSSCTRYQWLRFNAYKVSLGGCISLWSINIS